MKNWITQLIGVCAAVFVFSSCEKEEVQAVYQPGDAPAISVSSKTAALSADNPNAEALTFSWNPGSYGFQAAQKYVLQFDKKGGNFAAAKSIEVGSGTSYKATSKELNNVFIALGMPAGTAGEIDVRVVSSVDPKIKNLASAATTITGIPYASIVVYPSVYVPGSYQGWTPDKAATLAAFTSNTSAYQGYVYFPDASTEFKITKTPTWGPDSNIFGDAGDGTTGNLANPGNNFKVSGAGYYLLKVDFTDGKFTATKTTWAIVGSATANGWSVDTPMSYDPATHLWSVTTNLTAGEIKFRANSDWGINLGDGYKDANGKQVGPDGLLEYNGDNIKIAADGTYQITLDLSNAGNFQYKVTKK